MQHLSGRDRENHESSSGGPDRDSDPNKATTVHSKHTRLTQKAEKAKGTAIYYLLMTLYLEKVKS